MKVTFFLNYRTKNILRSLFFTLEYIKMFFLRKHYFDLYHFFRQLKYSGHLVVSECLDIGSKNLGIDYNFYKYNNKFNEIAIVNSGIENLKLCLREKKNNHIKFIVAGTNLVVSPKEFNSIISDSLIDLIITPSKWVSNYYMSMEPKLKNRVKEWYSGVNHNYWKNLNLKRTFITFYLKESNGPIIDSKNYIRAASNLGYQIKIIRYDRYNNKEYRRILNKSKILVYFVNQESQGLATAEAWACDTPTLIWNNTSTVINGEKVESSCCPYLSQDCGKFFNSLDDFKKILVSEMNSKNNYHPREWVLKNMTYEVSVKKLINLIEETKA